MPTRQPIVAGLDFSPGSEGAFLRAADLAERFHTRLHLLHATPVFHSGYGNAQPEIHESLIERRLRDFAEDAIGGSQVLDALGPEIVLRRGEAPADALIRYAEEVDAGLLVLGTHGHRGIRRFLMGSTAEEVVRRAPCLVLTVPNGAARTAPSPDTPILVPVDSSQMNGAALATARLMADHFDAPIELVHVVEEAVPYPDFYREVPGVLTMYDTVPVVDYQKVEEEVRRFAEEQGEGEVARCHVRSGRPQREIAEIAEEIGAGLIVMATHGLTGLDHALLGSVTERTLRSAPCPVLSFRGSTDD